MRIHATAVLVTALGVGCGDDEATSTKKPKETTDPDPVTDLAAAFVITPSGPMQGVVADGVGSYRGIPYAAPPVGDLRWRRPAAKLSARGWPQLSA